MFQYKSFSSYIFCPLPLIYPSLNPSPGGRDFVPLVELKPPLGSLGGKSQLIVELEAENKIILFQPQSQ